MLTGKCKMLITVGEIPRENSAEGNELHLATLNLRNWSTFQVTLCKLEASRAQVKSAASARAQDAISQKSDH